MRISDWSSDVCSSDLEVGRGALHGSVDGRAFGGGLPGPFGAAPLWQPQPPAAHGFHIAQLARHALGLFHIARHPGVRSEERRGGKERVSTSRSRGSPDPYQKTLYST